MNIMDMSIVRKILLLLFLTSCDFHPVYTSQDISKGTSKCINYCDTNREVCVMIYGFEEGQQCVAAWEYCTRDCFEAK